MHVHPLIHSELARQRRLDLERDGRRRREPARELASLVRAARKGDQKAWEELVGRFTPMLRAVAGSYRLNGADGDDVVQATWTAAFTHLDSLRDPEAIGGWLAVTARREALRLIDRRSRELAVDEPRAPTEAEPTTPESVLLAAEEHNAVHAAVGRLPGHQRRVLGALLRHADVSYVEIAGRLRIPTGSIGPTRQRALARLRRDDELGELFPTPGRDGIG
jgi:RNA polymerase sigma factor (sigma-70 family)